ncbi:MAG: beta-1,6-N-acetylglucosaminyltransferase [Bacillus sp. (in: firmicutes)]
MEIAYLILSHKNPEQIIQLIHQLDAEDVCFIIHFDLNGRPADYHKLLLTFEGKENVHLISNRHRCYWGDFSLVSATLECITYAFHYKIKFDYAILLSGQDFPIKKNEEIKTFLIENNGKEFIDAFQKPNSIWLNEGMKRLEYFHFNKFIRNNISYKKKVFLLITSLLMKFKIKRKLPTFEFYGGSQWWGLSKEFLEYVMNYIENNKKTVSFFKYVHVPDEIFFQTIINNSPFKDKVTHNLTYVDWDKEEKPAVFRTKDFNDLSNIKDKLFARKFDIKIDKEIFDKIKEVLLK